MTWDELLDVWLQDARLRGRSERTLHESRRRLAGFVGWCRERGVSPADLSAADVAAWLGAARAGGARPRTLFDGLERLRTWLRWAARRGHLLLDVAREIRLRKPPSPPRRLLTVPQVETLLEAPDATTALGLRDQAALELLYGTGLRRSEWQALDLDDLDRSGRCLAVRRGKGGEARRLPIGEHLAAVLDRYLEESRPALARRRGATALFLTVAGGRLHADSLSKLLRFYGVQAGLGRVSPHLLRHAFATHLLENGAPLVAVQHLLGHRCLKSTEVYTRIHPTELVRVYRRTHPRARRTSDMHSAEGRPTP